MELLTVLVVVMGGGRVHSLQSFMRLPEDTDVEAGSSVTLPCLVAEKGGECWWELDGRPVGAEAGKYEYSGDTEAGDCSLAILEAAQQWDEGGWVCQVSASVIEAGDSLVSRPAVVRVVARPEQLYIQHGAAVFRGEAEDNVIRVQEEASLHLTCVSVGGRPAPVLSWHGPHSWQLQQLTSDQTSLQLGAGWVTSREVLGVAARRHHRATITCAAHHPALAAPRLVTVRLSVEAAPRPVISRAGSEEVSQGEDVALSCEAAASNPPLTSLHWHRRGQPRAVLARGPQLTLRGVRPEDIGSYVCVAENSVGRGEAEFQLQFPHAARVEGVVTAPPPSAPQLVTAPLHGRAELRCLARGRPAPRVWWAGPGGRVVAHGAVLQLPRLGHADTGDYTCVAENTVRGAVTRDTWRVTVEVRGPPVILGNYTAQLTAVRGARAELAVEFCSRPAAGARWLDEAGRLVAASAEVAFSVTQLRGAGEGGCYVARMRLRSAQPRHSGLYTLELHNDLGSASRQLRVRVEDPAASVLQLEVVVATSAGLLLTILVLLLVLASLCVRQARRLAQAEVESGATLAGSEVTATSSRNTSTEELLSVLLASSSPLSPDTEDIYGFPRAANRGSSRKDPVERKVFNDSGYIHINTNAYSYVSFDDVDKQISNIL